jgi:hypothetical protein
MSSGEQTHRVALLQCKAGTRASVCRVRTLEPLQQAFNCVQGLLQGAERIDVDEGNSTTSLWLFTTGNYPFHY